MPEAALTHDSHRADLMSNPLILNNYYWRGFCVIQNNQGLGKGYQPQPLDSTDNPYLDLDYSGYHKNQI